MNGDGSGFVSVVLLEHPYSGADAERDVVAPPLDFEEHDLYESLIRLSRHSSYVYLPALYVSCI